MDKPTKSAKDKKQDMVGSLSDKIAKSKTVTFADYRGLSANQIAKLRKKVKVAGGEFVVTKNTLTVRALAANNIKVDIKDLKGPTATIFAYEDEIAPIKEIAQSQTATELPKFKFGFFEKNLLDQTQLSFLAKLPAKNVLQAKVVGAIASPIYGLVNVLQGNIRNLVYTLDAIKDKKGATG